MASDLPASTDQYRRHAEGIQRAEHIRQHLGRAGAHQRPTAKVEDEYTMAAILSLLDA